MTFDGILFIVLGEKVMWCHQQPNRNKATKRRREERVNKENVSTQELRKYLLTLSLSMTYQFSYLIIVAFIIIIIINYYYYYYISIIILVIFLGTRPPIH